MWGPLAILRPSCSIRLLVGVCVSVCLASHSVAQQSLNLLSSCLSLLSAGIKDVGLHNQKPFSLGQTSS